MRKILLTMAFMLYLTISALSQGIPDGYDPFVTANLDDPGKLTEAPVVESSYHYYSLAGDQNYKESSTFVWYVENGTFGTYDSSSDSWTPISSGPTLELTGENINGVPNSSGIWVRWNDGSGNSTGYVAVYERSSANCILTDQITGYKHDILVPPEVWFLIGEREECSDQFYSVSAQLNETRVNSFPYTLTYTYPGPDGLVVQKDTSIYETDLDGSGLLTWDLTGVQDLTEGFDEPYAISILSIRDSFGSEGKIAPLGEPSSQFAEISIVILHLPQTGNMNMD